MLLYLIIFLLLIYGVASYDCSKRRSKGNIYYWVIWVIMTLMIAFSYNMGNDWVHYLEDYSSVPKFSSLHFSDLEIGGRAQPLWIYLNSITRIYGGEDFTFFMFVHAVIVNGFIFWFVQRFSSYKFSVILLFFLSFNFFYFNIDVLRESLAVSLFLVAWKYLCHKKIFIYYLLCLIAFLFHASAIFSFLIPPLFYVLKWKRKKAFFIVFALIVIILWNLQSYTYLIANASYLSGVVDQFEYYNALSSNKFNLILASIIGSIPIFIFIYLSKTIKNCNETFLNSAYVVLLISLGGPAIIGLERLNNYLLIPYYIFIINLCYNIRKELYRILMLTAFAIMFVMQTYHYLQENILAPGELYYQMYIPYRSIFDSD